MKTLWIEEIPTLSAPGVRYVVHTEPAEDAVRFIEYSAYEELKQELSETVHTLHNVIKHGLPGAMYEGSHQHKMQQENERLKAALEYACRDLPDCLEHREIQKILKGEK